MNRLTPHQSDVLAIKKKVLSYYRFLGLSLGEGATSSASLNVSILFRDTVRLLAYGIWIWLLT
jgi:hypothetical protein